MAALVKHKSWKVMMEGGLVSLRRHFLFLRLSVSWLFTVTHNITFQCDIVGKRSAFIYFIFMELFLYVQETVLNLPHPYLKRAMVLLDRLGFKKYCNLTTVNIKGPHCTIVRSR